MQMLLTFGNLIYLHRRNAEFNLFITYIGLSISYLLQLAGALFVTLFYNLVQTRVSEGLMASPYEVR